MVAKGMGKNKNKKKVFNSAKRPQNNNKNAYSPADLTSCLSNLQSPFFISTRIPILFGQHSAQIVQIFVISGSLVIGSSLKHGPGR